MTVDPARLYGLRILIVEDNYNIAATMARLLKAQGAEIVGPATSIAEGLALITTVERIDGAVLDINLRGHLVYPVVDALRNKGVPMVFVTGYEGDSIKPGYRHIPALRKPLSIDRVIDAIVASRKATLVEASPLLEVLKSRGSSATYDVEYAVRKQVLLIRIGATLTPEIYMHQYRTAQRCVAANGLSSFILDLSRVRNFDLSYPFLLRIGAMRPAIPSSMSRNVVAPQSEVYKAARIVEVLRKLGSAPIRLERDMERVLSNLGVTRRDFTPI